MKYAFVEPEFPDLALNKAEKDVESQRQHVAHYIQEDDSETQLADIIVSNFGRTDYIDWKKEIEPNDTFTVVLEKINQFECREPVCDLLPYPFVVFSTHFVDTIITDKLSEANIDLVLARYKNLKLYRDLRNELLHSRYEPDWANRLQEFLYDSYYGDTALPSFRQSYGHDFFFCTVEIIGWWHFQQKISIVYVSY